METVFVCLLLNGKKIEIPGKMHFLPRKNEIVVLTSTFGEDEATDKTFFVSKIVWILGSNIKLVQLYLTEK